MSKPESVLIIDPAQELKFRGEFETNGKKVFAKKESSPLRRIFSCEKTTIMESNADCNLLNGHGHFRWLFCKGRRVSWPVREVVLR